MLTFKKGDIFQSKAQVLVNAVNCVGVMGAGLAAAFKSRYPEMNASYVEACNEQNLKPGGIHIYPLNEHRYIFNVATKLHWRTDSRYEWIADAVVNMAYAMMNMGVTSLATPALGCGLGGLDWQRVKKIMEEADWQNFDIEVYEPL